MDKDRIKFLEEENATLRAKSERLELRLKEVEDRFDNIMRFAKENFWEVDTEGKFTFMSSSEKNFMGYTPDEIVGKMYFYDLFEENDKEDVKKRAFEIFENRETFNDFLNVNYDKNGEKRWILTSGCPIYDSKGEFAGYRGADLDITEIVKAERKLKESDKKHKIIHEQMQMAYAFTNPEGRIVEFNPMFKEMLGYEEEEIYELTYEDITPKSWHNFEKRILEDQLISRGYSDVYEKEYITKDGRRVPIEIRTYLYRNDKGEPKGMWAFVNDISDKKAAEQLLIESENKYKSLFDSATDAILLIDALSLRIIDANAAATEMSAIPAEELIGSHIFDFDLGPAFSPKEEIIKELREKGENYLTGEFRNLKGETLTVEISNKLIYISDNPHILTFIRDIGDRLEKEKELLKLESAAKHSPAAIVITDADGKIEYINPSFTELTGFSFEEAVGLNPRVLKSGVHSRDYYKKLWQTISSGETWRGEFYNKNKNGEFFWEEAAIAPVVSPKGKIINYVAVKTNITARKKAEAEAGKLIEELKTANETIVEEAKKLQKLNHKLIDSESELRELNATKDKFFSIIAHDLKNPFNSLLTMTEFMSSAYDDIPEEVKKKEIKNLYSAARHSYKLLENLLEWSRLKLGRVPFDREENVFYEIALNNTYLIKPQATKNGVSVINDTPENCQAKFDYRMIDGVVRNLMSNALKFTPEGGEIRIGASFESDVFSFFVADTGTGISPEDQTKLFRTDESFSTKGVRNEAGTGLGLILCKEFVDKHGGEISVESELGKGAKFTVKLPQ